MTFRFITSLLAAIVSLSIVAGPAIADPWPNQRLKFYQMPLNNGFTPYLPGVGTLPSPSSYGTVASTAIFPGHDEFSTAYATAYSTDPTGGGIVPIAWEGDYMADDFADYANTPVRHVRWWGSYLNQSPTEPPHVKKFLISFEHNIPESGEPGTPGYVPSHPDSNHPGNLHQIVDLVPGFAPPPPGAFTEKLLPTPPGPISPREALYEYNAELHLDKWFFERAAERGLNNVYWLKIVALVDPQQDGPIQWGWHNRDWSIPNDLAAKPGDTPDGAERIIGTVPGLDGTDQPVWHFEDNAVLGGIRILPGQSPIMPIVEQTELFEEQYYLPPWDGPTPIVEFSKDLAFELYTIPEPATAGLLALGILAIIGMLRRR